MPGASPRNTRFANNAERLAQYLLSGVSFATAIQRQEDVGDDFVCWLVDYENSSAQVLVPGPGFTVQVKRNLKPFEFLKPTERRWLASLENPHFVGEANTTDLCLTLYPTWPVVLARLMWGSSVPMRLNPDKGITGSLHNWREGDDPVEVPLGCPILRIDADEATDTDRMTQLSRVLKAWILFHRRLIVFSQVGYYAHLLPEEATTNEEPTLSSEGLKFTNEKNLPQSMLLAAQILDQMLDESAKLAGNRNVSIDDVLGLSSKQVEVLRDHVSNRAKNWLAAPNVAPD